MIFKKKKLWLVIILIVILFLAAIVAIVAGEYKDITIFRIVAIIWFKISGFIPESITDLKIVSFMLEKINVFFPKDISNAQTIIVWKIRLPRVILAVNAGLALAISGAAYQGCFRNPLVEPYILGVSSGAACGASLAIVWSHIFPQTQVSAFLFALSAVMITYSLAKSKGRLSVVALVLAGIIVGALFSAVVGIVKYLSFDTQLREITFWMMGGLYHATWYDALVSTFVISPCFLFIWWSAWRLNILSLGDEEAQSLGLNPGRTRLILIITATMAAAISVSFTGIIAWVGLMMPHAARLLFGPDNRWVIPGAAILGAIYLLICDTIARTLTGAEIPIGIITSILGAPYLIWLLRSKGRELYGL